MIARRLVWPVELAAPAPRSWAAGENGASTPKYLSAVCAPVYTHAQVPRPSHAVGGGADRPECLLSTVCRRGIACPFYLRTSSEPVRGCSWPGAEGPPASEYPGAHSAEILRGHKCALFAGALQTIFSALLFPRVFFCWYTSVLPKGTDKWVESILYIE
ncbi:hypothetical protein MRX96_016847 [Rhipicephalus microplus]